MTDEKQLIISDETDEIPESSFCCFSCSRWTRIFIAFVITLLILFNIILMIGLITPVIEKTESTFSENFNLFLKHIEDEENQDHEHGNIITEGTRAIQYLLNIGSRSKRALNSDFAEEPKKSFFDVPPKKSFGKCEAKHHNHDRISKDRIKRETDLDPVNNAKLFAIPEPEDDGSKLQYIRLKRKAEKILHYLEREFQRCSRDIKTDKNCKEIYEKFVLLTEEVNKRFSDFAQDFQKHTLNAKDNKAKEESTITLDNKNETKEEIKEGDSATGKPEASQLVPTKQSHHEEDLVKQIHLSDGFYYSYQQPPKVHEDLIDDAFNTELDMVYPELSSDELTPLGSERKGETNKEDSNKGGAGAGIALKTQDITGASGPFLSLCDQLGRQNAALSQGGQQSNNNNNNKPHNNPGSGFAYFNGPQYQTIHQFSGHGQGNVPVTGESMKASAQVMLNPGFSYSASPICFYPAQPVQALRVQQPYYATQPLPTSTNQGEIPIIYHVTSSSVDKHPLYGGEFIEPRSATEGFIYVPANLQSINVGVSASDSQSRSATGNPVASPLFCTYLPSNSPQLFNMGHFRHANDPVDMYSVDGEIPMNIPSDTDIIYASYANQMTAFTNRTQTSTHNYCPPGQVSCFNSHQCIPSSKWCDSKVDCIDASDESACSCKSRLSRDKICDGYPDCPMGSDEIGCFGCDKFSYSCYSTREEYADAKKSSFSACYTVLEKCDGEENCLNGKDEKDCSMIVRTIGQHTSYMVSYTEGYLHRNYKGKWYPVCEHGMKWAKDACEAEVGPLESEPILSYKSGLMPGQYIQPAKPNFMAESLLHEPSISDKCSPNGDGNVILYVKCPPMKCGVSMNKEYKSPLRIRTSLHSAEEKTTEANLESQLRIVGGSESNPLEWPYVIAVYRNGHFHCGGTIHTELWVITAAHCVRQHFKYYYEIRAGLLRRFSYSPMVQTVKVSSVVVNEHYSREDMRNDLALLKLETPLLFNRWVRPICLPGPDKGDDWLMGPSAGTLCQAIGWGAIREKGPNPDNLREVSVPIIGVCKHSEDRVGHEICAGEKEGGHDACQGDSGGPLFCKNPTHEDEVYLAGVTSHGEGCARPDEPGVYTRVSLFIDWVVTTEQSIMHSRIRPKQECPGYRCVWGGGLCISKKHRCDGVVHCLGGEDEIGCSSFDQYLGASQNDTSESGSSSSESNESSDSDGSTVAPDEIDKLVDAMVPLAQNSTKGRQAEEEVPAKVKNLPSKNVDKLDVDGHGDPQKEEENEDKDSNNGPSTPENPALITQPTESTPVTSTSTITAPFANTTTAPQRAIGVPHVSGQENNSTKSETPTTNKPEAKPSKSEATTSKPEKSKDEPAKSKPEPTKGKDESTTQAPEPITHSPLSPPFHNSFNPSKAYHIPNIPHYAHENYDGFQKDNQRRNASRSRSDFEVPGKFVCHKIPQTINIIHRCDMVVDCDDGTDEEDCTCRDYLNVNGPHNICDGKVDCADLTDENGCLTCNQEEFPCLKSNKCIKKSLRCDEKIDCEMKEDELDCLALSDGKTITLDANLRPILNYKGIVCKNTKGEWKVLCSDEEDIHKTGPETASQVCSILGFSGYHSYNSTTVEQARLLDKIDTKSGHLKSTFLDKTNNYGQNIEMLNIAYELYGVHQYEEFVGDSKHCVALYVECVPHSTVNVSDQDHQAGKATADLKDVIFPIKPIIQPNKKPIVIVEFNQTLIDNHFAVEEEHWPWSARIYIDGKLVCIGILLDKYWVITESTCLKLVNLEFDYVVVVLGGSKTHLKVHGIYEQIIRINCVKFVDYSNVVLLNLERPAHYNRECLPSYISEKTDINLGTSCFALSHNKFGKLQSLTIEHSSKECFPKFKCFISLIKDLKKKTKFHCDGDDVTRCGVVVCKSKFSGYYPSGFYTNRKGLCSFEKIYPIQTLSQYSKQIIEILDYHDCDFFHKPPICPGYRCTLGECLPDNRVCDGKFDCHDGSDESDQACEHKKHKDCLKTELKCRNGKCIPKSKFCDHVNDCGDLTDEPSECSCFTYYSATDSSRICDGVRNCWDKSDENPQYCKQCHSDSFKCESSNLCVPRDFVCDKDRDCPNGEDELYCYGLEYSSNENDGYRQVIQQSYGIWHTKCFPRPHAPSDAEIKEICRHLGYENVDKATGRVVHESKLAEKYSNSLNETSIVRYRQAPTKAAIFNKFSPLRVHPQLTLYVKPSRPIAKLERWNSADEENCFRFEVKCE